jgi:hypothetical protein
VNVYLYWRSSRQTFFKAICVVFSHYGKGFFSHNCHVDKINLLKQAKTPFWKARGMVTVLDEEPTSRTQVVLRHKLAALVFKSSCECGVQQKQMETTASRPLDRNNIVFLTLLRTLRLLFRHQRFVSSMQHEKNETVAEMYHHRESILLNQPLLTPRTIPASKKFEEDKFSANPEKNLLCLHGASPCLWARMTEPHQQSCPAMMFAISNY